MCKLGVRIRGDSMYLCTLRLLLCEYLSSVSFSIVVSYNYGTGHIVLAISLIILATARQARYYSDDPAVYRSVRDNHFAFA